MLVQSDLLKHSVSAHLRAKISPFGIPEDAVFSLIKLPVVGRSSLLISPVDGVQGLVWQCGQWLQAAAFMNTVCDDGFIARHLYCESLRP